jgi:glutamine synthetase type III
MACIVAAVDKYGDLMRMAIATPGNDFRLGGMEAPPAVMSTYLGEDLTNYLKSFVENPEVGEYKAHVSLINLGIPYLPEVFVRSPFHSLSLRLRHSALFFRCRWDWTALRTQSGWQRDSLSLR